METVLGVDLGTQSLKVVVYDFKAKKVIDSADAALSIEQDESGKSEQHASWWIDALKSAMAEISTEVKESVRAIGVSGQQHGFVPLDDNDEVIFNVKLWNDTTTVSQCEHITDAYGGEQALLETVGNTILPGYTIPKVLWLKDNHPDIYLKLATILLPHDFVNFYLTGEKVMEFGDASGTGVLNIKTRRWDEGLLNVVDPEKDLLSCLPDLVEANQPIGLLKDDIAAELGLRAGIAVSSGGGDNMMAAIGTGNVRNGVATVSLGTSSTLFAFSDCPIVDCQGGEVAAFCSSTNGWLPLVCSLNCSNAKDVIEQLLGGERDYVQFERDIASVLPGSGGVLTLPFYNGERSPYLPAARGSILGLTPHNTNRANLVRSAIEGATYTLKMGFERLLELGMSIDEIRLTGGGSKSATWYKWLPTS
ncbi:xylulokinase [Veronia nyctiphanis]|uniref:Xylulose kinase n=1 Tax=Veronia nyctiphanis TaxID=1278244 RepID=A0A4V1LT59_9GAMM|nr:xylulokinase [Veronia nyctiphanis]